MEYPFKNSGEDEKVTVRRVLSSPDLLIFRLTNKQLQGIFTKTNTCIMVSPDREQVIYVDENLKSQCYTQLNMPPEVLSQYHKMTDFYSSQIKSKSFENLSKKAKT